MRKASELALAQARAIAQHHNYVSSNLGDSTRDSHIRLDADETN